MEWTQQTQPNQRIEDGEQFPYNFSELKQYSINNLLVNFDEYIKDASKC